MPAKFDLKKSKRGRFMWNLLATNGEVILTSQQYRSKAGAKKGIASVQSSVSSDGSFERRQAKNGRDYFVVKAGNGRVVGQSEQYSTNRAMENGIKSVSRNAPKAAIRDSSV